MISKGNTHQNGVKLARYMLTPKEGERVELFELKGFASSDIKEAFRSVHVMAEGTKCLQPFFHCQVRNRDEEELTREQWLRVANRIESKLGLTDQPRAICFHIDQVTGHEHMHVAWSRIDAETMRAVPLPFFKERLKEVSRELEIELGLTRVKNERDGPVMAPNRNEFEEARRLGVDIQAVRNTIRDCFERSDGGRSFEAALADHGFVLAQGDRRAFVVIDHEGGIHALGKRVLGITSGQTRDRLADLDRDQLPTVEQARTFIREPMRDPNREEMSWQDKLAKAAIEKEKVERRFAEPLEVERQAVRELGEVGLLRRKGDHPPPEHLSNIEKRIWLDYHERNNARSFVAALADHKIALASVTKDEADRSHREAEFAKAIGNYAPRYREGEILAITEPGPVFRREGQPADTRRVYRLNTRTTGDEGYQIEQFLKPVRNQLRGLDETKEILRERGADRSAFWAAIRLENSERGRDGARTPGKAIRLAPVTRVAERISGKALKSLDLVGNALESVLAPVLTPEQKREGARTMRERAAAAADKIDMSQYVADRELARQRQEQEREAARQRQRDDQRDR